MQVDSETCLIVVDGGDGKAIELARALKASGRSRAYVLEVRIFWKGSFCWIVKWSCAFWSSTHFDLECVLQLWP